MSNDDVKLEAARQAGAALEKIAAYPITKELDPSWVQVEIIKTARENAESLRAAFGLGGKE